MVYLLVTGTDWSRRPEYASSFPSWLCGFDSRRPLFCCPVSGMFRFAVASTKSQISGYERVLARQRRRAS
jgi:hypothetical protein